LSQNQLAVDDPSSQPFVTGVGGTTLQARGPRPTESVWNSGGTIVGGLLQPGAGGGGISNLWPMPRYQLDAASALRVLGAGRTGAACDDAGGYCREVPDVSGNADPATGYVVYWTGGDPGEPSGWQSIGGTSAAAPVWSALLTLADASRACAGNPIGFANPALYRAAGSGYAGDFNDVLSGNNDFTSANGGRFAAGPGYDEASGLGSPNGGPLAAALCADTLKLVNPGRPRLTVHAAVSLRVRALDPRGVSINYAARGLPSGLLLNVTTGRITGHPRRTGTALIRVTAQDSEGSVSSTAFTVTVGRAPKVSRASVAGLRGRRPRVSFTVTAGRGAPPFQRLTVSLPSGLRLASTRGVAIRTRGVRHPRFRARLAGGRLQITLRRSLSELSVALSHRAVKAVSGRRARSRGRAAKLGLSIVDTGSGTSQLQSRLAAVR
jgi:kumamolisin